MMKYNLVIWDWNGTLLDDVSASLRSVNDMLARRNMPPISIDRYRECIGVPIRVFYEQVFDLSAEDYPSLLEEYNAGYMHYMMLDITLAEGSKELLERIKRSGAKQIIVSSCEQNQLDEAVKKHGVYDYFDAVLGSDDFFAGSKVQRALDYIAKNYGGSTPSILAVGDLLHDAELARDTGAYSVLVASGHESRARLDASGSEIVETVADIGRILDN